MIPFQWSSRDDSNPTILKFAAEASGIRAAQLLRPASDQALSSLVDAALQQELTYLVRSADRLIELSLALQDNSAGRISPPPFWRGIVVSEPVIQRIATDQSDARVFLPVAAATVYFGPGLVARFELTTLDLERGSLRAIIGVGVTGVILPIVLVAAAPWAQSKYNDQLTTNEINRTIEGTPCQVDFAAQLDIELMRSLAVTNLKKSHAQSNQERRLRVCLLQTMLHLNGAYAGFVDGIEGPLTKAALKKFATGSGLRASQTDSAAFYDALISGIQPKR